MAIQVAMSGTRKAAILALVLGEDVAARIFRHLSEAEIESIAKEVAGLGTIQPDAGERVLDEFHQLSLDAEYLTRGGVENARKLLHKSMGADAATKASNRVAKAFQSTVGFNSLELADAQQLSKFILAENPQTVALILAHLNPAKAAQLIALLPEALRADVLTRMANLDEIAPEVVGSISSVIEQRLKTLGGTSRGESHGGVRAVAELFNRLERSVSHSVLATIESQLPDLAVSIRNLMFVFDDLLNVDDAAVREIVQRVDKKMLCIALKGASEEIRARFFGNMSKRAAEMLKEEMEVLGAIRLREVEKAQLEVVAVTRKLEDEGIIATGSAAGEAYVV
jgi:flagellar motor switch protein FliG